MDTEKNVNSATNQETNEKVANPEMGLGSGISAGEVGAPTSPVVQSNLNPLANEWNPSTQRAPEHERCLYLTFSNGFPLSESQISNFFNEKFGQCVETVYVHWPKSPATNSGYPLFGKVVFSASYIPALVLNGRDENKFVINNRTLWCKKFVPKQLRVDGEEESSSLVV